MQVCAGNQASTMGLKGAICSTNQIRWGSMSLEISMSMMKGMTILDLSRLIVRFEGFLIICKSLWGRWLRDLAGMHTRNSRRLLLKLVSLIRMCIHQELLTCTRKLSSAIVTGSKRAYIQLSRPSKSAISISQSVKKMTIIRWFIEIRIWWCPCRNNKIMKLQRQKRLNEF